MTGRRRRCRDCCTGRDSRHADPRPSTRPPALCAPAASPQLPATALAALGVVVAVVAAMGCCGSRYCWPGAARHMGRCSYRSKSVDAVLSFSPLIGQRQAVVLSRRPVAAIGVNRRASRHQARKRRSYEQPNPAPEVFENPCAQCAATDPCPWAAQRRSMPTQIGRHTGAAQSRWSVRRLRRGVGRAGRRPRAPRAGTPPPSHHCDPSQAGSSAPSPSSESASAAALSRPRNRRSLFQHRLD